MEGVSGKRKQTQELQEKKKKQFERLNEQMDQQEKGIRWTWYTQMNPQ